MKVIQRLSKLILQHYNWYENFLNFCWAKMLTHFSSILHFYIPWKRQKTIDFLIFFSEYKNINLAQLKSIRSKGLICGRLFVVWTPPEAYSQQNVCRLFQILAQFTFTKNEAELDYYHQKVNARVVSQIARLFK